MVLTIDLTVALLPVKVDVGPIAPHGAGSVDDVEGVVDQLASKGVTFERYDEGTIITDEKGIATFEGGAKVAYFRDPDGNTLPIAQAPRF